MARPPITARGDKLFRVQLDDVLDYLEGISGGGGGAASWGTITGTLSSQTDLNSALAGKAASTHTHAQSDVTGLVSALSDKAATSHTHTASDVTDFSEAVDDRVSTLLVEGTNVTLTYNDVAGTLTIDAAGSGGAPQIMHWMV